jgi:hypothetical protein
VQLTYEVREQMQRSLRRANIREVFVCLRDGKVRVTALVDSRSFARMDLHDHVSTVETESAQWKSEHFEVLQGEVTE